MTPQRLVFETTEHLIDEFVGRFATSAAEAIAARGRFACAVPGGSVAVTLLPALASAPVDWTRVDVFWVDERAVPPDSEESNFGVAWRVWLDRLAERPTVHRMRGEAPNLDAAAGAYEEALTARLGMPPRLDLAILGAGADGHVASLFPGHPALDETERSVVTVRDAPKPPPQRLTLTLPVLTAARSTCVIAFGPEKTPMLSRVLADPESSLPVARVLRGGREAVLMSISARPVD